MGCQMQCAIDRQETVLFDVLPVQGRCSVEQVLEPYPTHRLLRYYIWFGSRGATGVSLEIGPEVSGPESHP